MAKISLHSDSDNGATAISNVFIDKYMSFANGEYVKVYLYLLRCLGSVGASLSVSAIADNLEYTEKDIMRALKYWHRQGLLDIEYDEDKKITGIGIIDPALAIVSKAPVKKTAASKKSVAVNSTVEAVSSKKSPNADMEAYSDPLGRQDYTLDEVKAFRKNPEISELFFIVEAYIKHPLSSTDTNTILFWYDKLHFGTDLIDYLVEYCVSKGHSSLKYMDKVALGWADSGIKTIEQAKEEAASHSKAYYAVMKALGISGRNLVDSEITYVNKWSKTYLFDVDIIQEACRRTISATHQPSFEYTDSILSSWYKNNVHSLKDIAALDELYSKTKRISVQTTDESASRRTKFTNFNQRNQNFDELEKMLLNTSAQ